MRKNFKKPPGIANRLLKKILPETDSMFLSGDFEETYNDMYLERGDLRSRIWYWKQVFRSIPLFLNNRFYNGVSMLKNYIKIALRNIWKQKLNTSINIVGLSLGLSCCILIFLFVTDEISYDNFHDKADSIYRVKWNDKYYDNSWAFMPVPFAPASVDYFPEVEEAVRFTNRGVLIHYGDKVIDEFFGFADTNFFNVFSFPLLTGDPQSVLKSEDSIVLTEQTAEKIFGEEDPNGKILIIQLGNEKREFVVSGIIKDIPNNTMVLFNAILPFGNLKHIENEDFFIDWGRFRVDTYLLMREDASPESVSERLPSFFDQHMEIMKQRRVESERWGEGSGLEIRNIRDLHLDPTMRGRLYSDINKSYILSAIALIVLFIACINFMNLSIGRSSARSLEIGVRKVMGAGKKQLIRQYWIESLLMTFFALVLGVAIAIALLPAFNQMAQKAFSAAGIFNYKSVLAMVIIVFVVGITSAIYPALLISKYKPVEIFRQKLKIGRKNNVTKSLVIAQFLMSVVLISSTFIMTKQIEHIDNLDLGFEKDGLICVRIQENNIEDSKRAIELFRSKTQQNDDIVNITASSNSFGVLIRMAATTIKGQRIDTYLCSVYYDYVKTLEMNLIEGRDFSREFSTDTASIVVTKKLVDSFGLESPIGEVVQIGTQPPARIIGVVENFNFETLESEAGPAMLNMYPDQNLDFMTVRISSQNVSETIDYMEETWKEIQPDKPFRYSFVDADLSRHYDDERRWSSILKYSSIFVVIIACMGIFGLTSITVSNRTKEIGIRKVLGAKISQISGLIIKEYVLLIVIANVIAWPFIYYIMNKYLESFYYRISIEPIYLAISGILTLLLTVLTIFYIALRAAISNPVDSLRYE
ncbi:MAG: FtsX-like permease family protein [bacterium]|nr:FtsX-like permease family protein [bacterium]